MDTMRDRLVWWIGAGFTVVIFLAIVFSGASSGSLVTDEPFFGIAREASMVSEVLHGQRLGEGEDAIVYGMYVPKSFRAGSSPFIVLSSDGGSSRDFVASREGRHWLGIAESTGAMVAIVQHPEQIRALQRACLDSGAGARNG